MTTKYADSGLDNGDHIYSVKGALLIMSAVASHIVVCGLLVRSPKFYDKIRKNSTPPGKTNSPLIEEHGPLIPSKNTMDNNLLDRLYSSDPNTF